jgi:alcohol dehydrogenase
MEPFEYLNRTRLVFGEGAFDRLGSWARQLQCRRTLLVADAGMVSCGYVDRACQLLEAEGIGVIPFHGFGENPDTREVEAGREIASRERIDSLVALGGGSSLDCAKGINFLLTGGGTMRDYWGHGKLSARTDSQMLPQMLPQMRPMIGIPTTAGTGSEAQQYALISDAETHAKMACGDEQAAFRVALLDPVLTLTKPRQLTATTGYDAISHAVESYVTRRRTPLSQLYSLEAWRLLEGNYERVLTAPSDLAARGAMLLGSYLAGMAIEASMLGAAHSCANPLTRRHGVAHGQAIALMLPSVVRWNGEVVDDLYGQLLAAAGRQVIAGSAAALLAERLAELRRAGGLPATLRQFRIEKTDLPVLAAEAAQQWTGNFNPRQWSEEGALEVYQSAL